MSNLEKSIFVTGLDIAKKFGFEKEYKEALFEAEERKNFENVMTGEITQFDNIIVEADDLNEKPE